MSYEPLTVAYRITPHWYAHRVLDWEKQMRNWATVGNLDAFVAYSQSVFNRKFLDRYESGHPMSEYSLYPLLEVACEKGHLELAQWLYAHLRGMDEDYNRYAFQCHFSELVLRAVMPRNRLSWTTKPVCREDPNDSHGQLVIWLFEIGEKIDREWPITMLDKMANLFSYTCNLMCNVHLMRYMWNKCYTYMFELCDDNRVGLFSKFELIIESVYDNYKEACVHGYYEIAAELIDISHTVLKKYENDKIPSDKVHSHNVRRILKWIGMPEYHVELFQINKMSIESHLSLMYSKGAQKALEKGHIQTCRRLVMDWNARCPVYTWQNIDEDGVNGNYAIFTHESIWSPMLVDMMQRVVVNKTMTDKEACDDLTWLSEQLKKADLGLAVDPTCRFMNPQYKIPSLATFREQMLSNFHFMDNVLRQETPVLANWLLNQFETDAGRAEVIKAMSNHAQNAFLYSCHDHDAPNMAKWILENVMIPSGKWTDEDNMFIVVWLPALEKAAEYGKFESVKWLLSPEFPFESWMFWREQENIVTEACMACNNLELVKWLCDRFQVTLDGPSLLRVLLQPYTSRALNVDYDATFQWLCSNLPDPIAWVDWFQQRLKREMKELKSNQVIKPVIAKMFKKCDNYFRAVAGATPGERELHGGNEEAVISMLREYRRLFREFRDDNSHEYFRHICQHGNLYVAQWMFESPDGLYAPFRWQAAAPVSNAMRRFLEEDAALERASLQGLWDAVFREEVSYVRTFNMNREAMEPDPDRLDGRNVFVAAPEMLSWVLEKSKPFWNDFIVGCMRREFVRMCGNDKNFDKVRLLMAVCPQMALDENGAPFYPVWNSAFRNACHVTHMSGPESACYVIAKWIAEMMPDQFELNIEENVRIGCFWIEHWEIIGESRAEFIVNTTAQETLAEFLGVAPVPRKLEYRSGTLSLSGICKENQECAVCSAAKVEVATECSHYYCKQCITDWVEKYRNTSCPMCRNKIHTVRAITP